MRSEVEPELLLHATQELGHAELVVNRIIQLGGTPLLNPVQWKEYARCPYDEPSDPYIETILNQNLNGERCAIQRYEEIAEYTAGKDHSTIRWRYRSSTRELEHEHDIEDWIRDIERMKEDIRAIACSRFATCLIPVTRQETTGRKASPWSGGLLCFSCHQRTVPFAFCLSSANRNIRRLLASSNRYHFAICLSSANQHHSPFAWRQRAEQLIHVRGHVEEL
jgi:bacterioferritin